MLAVRGLTRRFEGVVAVAGIDLDVAAGAFVSIIGPNGAGKSTLFNLISGLDRPDGGSVSFEGRDVTGARPERLAALGMARTFQHGRVFGNLSVLDNVLLGAHTRLRRVRPRVPVLGPLLELGLAAIRPRAVAAEERGLAPGRGRHPRRCSASGCCRDGTNPRTACPTPIAAAWRSPARSHCSRACCCSTSRPRA